MGSLEEEKLLQMVHDFIESSSSSSSDSTTYSTTSTPKHAHLLHSTRYFTLQEIVRKTTIEEKEIEEKVEKYMEKKMELEKTTRLKQWVVKCLNLDGFHASLCHTSWLTTHSCPSGNYEYIEVIKEIDEDGARKRGMVRIIVDIEFKSQFEVARPTQSYLELSSKAPMIFVGNEDKLKRIIFLLCSAAQDSLRERGLHVPPWRKPSYLLSKWNLLSNNNNNNSVYPNNKISANCNDYPSKLEKWAPQIVMIEKRRRELRGRRGSGLSNQFSNLSINCC